MSLPEGIEYVLVVFSVAIPIHRGMLSNTGLVIECDANQTTNGKSVGVLWDAGLVDRIHQRKTMIVELCYDWCYLYIYILIYIFKTYSTELS